MTFDEFAKALSFLSPATLLVGVIFGFFYNKYLSNVYKSITFYLLLMLCIEVLTKTLGALGNNLIVLPVFSLIELTFFLYLYNKHLLKKNNKFFIAIGLIGILYIFSEIILYFVLNNVKPKQFQPYSKVVDNFIVILMTLAFFHEKIKNYKEAKWNNFRLNSVILGFFTINLIIFLPFNFLVNESTGLKYYFWLINIVIIVLFYTYLTWSIWKNGRGRKQLAETMK